MSRALAAQGLRGVDADRSRDYNAPCPSGWLDRGDGDACDAPVSYDGPCGGTLHFGGLAAHEKIELADSCGVVFASAGVCATDFSVPCPVGWRLGGSAVCTAPVDYTGPCVRRKVFASMVAADKAWFENVCGVRWPCRAPLSSSSLPSVAEACDEDFSKPCPRSWADNNGVCLSHAAYDGPCSVAFAASAYTIEEKQVVSRDCNAPWPCMN
jgi:CPW-WPC domain-containing protein